MYSKNHGIESDGELYKMQQEAIRRARETANSAQKSPSRSHNDERRHDNSKHLAPKEPECEHKLEPSHNEKRGLFNIFGSGSSNNIFSNIFKNFKLEDILLILVLIMLVNDESDDDIIIIIAFLLFFGF